MEVADGQRSAGRFAQSKKKAGVLGLIASAALGLSAGARVQTRNSWSG